MTGQLVAWRQGKSNLVKAMDFAQAVVVESHQYWLPEEPIPRWPFRLDADSKHAPSAFVFDFVHHDVRYEYGFCLDDAAIREEWLYYWPRGKRSTLFERHGMALDFGPSLTGQKATIAELVRENSLFLSAAAANNHPQLRSVAAWFSSWRRISAGGVYHAWAVFDVESAGPHGQRHAGLDVAVARADRAGIRCAISHPCFELWVILHFRLHTAHLSNERARAKPVGRGGAARTAGHRRRGR